MYQALDPRICKERKFNTNFDKILSKNLLEKLNQTLVSSAPETLPLPDGNADIPTVVGYASLSLEENVDIIVTQILVELEKINSEAKKVRFAGFSTFLLQLLSDPTYEINDPHVQVR